MMIVTDIRTARTFKPTVLIIDDQPTVLEIHQAIIKSLHANLNIVTMTNPIDALNWAKRKQIDLVITDFSMHQMNGMQLMQAIHQTHPAVAPSIIVITVIKDKALHKALISAGATACLTKPVEVISLKKVVMFLLNKSKQPYNHQPIAIN